MVALIRFFGAGVLLAGSTFAPGCADGTSGRTPGSGFEIKVAPLTLPGITDICYTIEVKNDVGQTVWLQHDICADDYGDGIGAITYIGTCDAHDNGTSATNGTPDGASPNTVTLTIEDMYDVHGAIDRGTWDNPCAKLSDGSYIGAANAAYGDTTGWVEAGIETDNYGPCQLTLECEENQDTLVEFNLTIMRDAKQGFFDIAVNFEDIFCSAKVDCLDEFLHDANGNPGETVIIGFACTAGDVSADTGVSATQLHYSEVKIKCAWTDEFGTDDRDENWGPDSGAPDGNRRQSGSLIYDWAQYRGVEELPGFAKAYWNVALGINKLTDDGTVGDCNVTAKMAASSGEGLPTFGGDELVSYPYINVDVPVRVGDVLCENHELNGLLDDGTTPSGVQTVYDSDGTDDLGLENLFDCIEVQRDGSGGGQTFTLLDYCN